MKTALQIFRYFLFALLVLSAILIVPSLKRDLSVDDLKSRYADERSHFVDMNGMQVHYRDEGSGTPLVLLHGTGASLHSWEGWAAQLKPSFRVISVDLPGFGLTGPDHGASYDIDYYSKFLTEFFARLNIDAAILGGNSLGGYIAWYFAAQAPEKVRSLLLIDPAGINNSEWEPLVLTLARTPIVNGILRYATPRSFVRSNLLEVYHDDTKVTDELVERYYSMALREGNREAFIQRAHAQMAVDHKSLLRSIPSPTLILWGAEDAWVPPDLGSDFQELIPTSELVILPDMGHIPMEESPEESAQIVMDFLRQQGEWISLWNGRDLRGWETYLDTPYQRKKDENGTAVEPYGINNDPDGVMGVVDLEDGPAIRISGIAWGTLHTLATYGNYHLQLKVRWGTGMHAPRADGPRDSGLLYHGFGAPGAHNPWMASQELQIQEGDMGDYWPTGDVEIDVPSRRYDKGYYLYDENAPRRTYYFADYNSSLPEGNMTERRVLKGFDAERAHGEWNDIELVTLADSGIHIVNNQVVMRLYRSRFASSQAPLTSGRIALQSEGAEVYFKDIRLRSIDKIPSHLR